MNKSELVGIIAKEADVTKETAGKVLNATISGIVETLKKGEDVSLVGFGTFTVRHREARDGINPKTREKIRIQASKSPAFKAGKTFKDSIK